ncbi:MAG: sigma-E factor negative regulatory protein [bacterium]|jgi:sigma-E factor negative regulatory protein RseA
MKSQISTLVDGELEANASVEVIEALKRDATSRETWRIYHLISDALHDTALRAEGFSARFAERLAAEPTVLAPGRLAAERRRWVALSAAASVAAVALVGWLALAPAPELRPEALPSAPLASAPRTGAVAQPASTETLRPSARQVVVVQREAATPQLRPMPAAVANDYLFAHQEFSPGMSLQGVAPYIRTISAPVDEGMRR